MPYAVAFVVFASVGLLVWAGLSSVFSDERAVNRRLEGLSSYESAQAAVAHPELKPFSDRVVKPSGLKMREEIGKLAPSSSRQSIRHKLVLAGNPNGLDVDRFILIKVLLAVSLGALTIGAAAIASASALTWALAVGVTVLAFFLPDIWLSGAVDSRKKDIRLELPDMLDMLTISVEAGLGFDQAVSKIVRTSRGPLYQEMARALQEIQAGTDRSDALRHLTERTEVPELNAFITALVQAEQLGIPIGNVLRTQAREMRLTRRQRAEEQAQKTPVKIVFPLILCILPATLIVILGPAAVSIGEAFGLL